MSFNGYDYPPEAVMRTALTDTSGNITISFPDTNSYEGYMSLYFAELDPTANATSRIYYAKIPLFQTTLLNPVLINAKFIAATPDLITLSIPRDGIFFFIKTQLLPVLWVPW
jgi:hypothetical protein